MTTLTMTVTINGTDSNRWNRLGMTQNPFPQLGKSEYDIGEMQIASLDADPVTGPDDIRQRLRGFSDEFIEGCISRYTPGERVRFTISFPDRMS